MADGSAPLRQPVMVGEMLLGDRVLVASCFRPDCEAEAVVGDARSLSLRFASVARLEDELRCLCGARRGRLSSRPFWSPRRVVSGGIYLFVA